MIVLVVDSKDKEKLPEAAAILYDALSDIEIVTGNVPILVVCNKQDVVFAKRATIIERDLQQEIEQLRRVRKAVREQEQDGQSIVDNADQSGSGYLESLKGKFSFD